LEESIRIKYIARENCSIMIASVQVYKKLLSFFLLFYSFSCFSQQRILDNKFGNKGIQINPYPWEGVIRKLINGEEKTGSIEALGFPEFNMEIRIGIIKFNVQGLYDSSYGENGKSIIAMEVYKDSAFHELYALRKYEAISKTKDGHLITAGSELVNYKKSIVLFKYNIAGKLDSSFGTRGKVFTSIETNDEIIVTDIIETNNGKLYISSISYLPSGKKVAILRYSNTGKLEKIIYLNNKTTPANFTPMRIVETGNNKILISGYQEIKDKTYLILFKMDYDGNPDKEFGNRGVIEYRSKIPGEFVPHSAVIDKNNNIILANSAYRSDNSIGIIRLTSKGDLDKTFFKKGYINLTGIERYLDQPLLIVSNDNRIYVGFSGYNYNKKTTEYHLVKIKRQ
jgi:uncharacterized delta-60 repeat protein